MRSKIPPASMQAQQQAGVAFRAKIDASLEEGGNQILRHAMETWTDQIRGGNVGAALLALELIDSIKREHDLARDVLMGFLMGDDFCSALAHLIAGLSAKVPKVQRETTRRATDDLRYRAFLEAVNQGAKGSRRYKRAAEILTQAGFGHVGAEAVRRSVRDARRRIPFAGKVYEVTEKIARPSGNANGDISDRAARIMSGLGRNAVLSITHTMLSVGHPPNADWLIHALESPPKGRGITTPA